MGRREDLVTIAGKRGPLAEKYPAALIVEAWHSDPAVQRKWERFGFIPLLAMDENGIKYNDCFVPDSYVTTDAQAEYNHALHRMRHDIASNTLPEKELAKALGHMFMGSFEESEFARFLPGQE